MSYGLVAGGSRGIGFAIACALARRKYNLVLVGRNQHDLEVAKEELETTYGITVELFQQDLSQPEASEKVAEFCRQKKLPLTMLCNVAGLGGGKDFLTLSLEELQYMISLNLTAHVSLCANLIPLLEKNAPAHILNVASMAGFAPIPKKNVYASTKSALLFFSYSLHHQLKNKNISVSCLCPGPVFTKEEVIKETEKNLGWFGKVIAVNPLKVGEIAVKATLKGKLIIVPGAIAYTMAMVLRMLPRNIISAIYFKLGEKKS